MSKFAIIGKWIPQMQSPGPCFVYVGTIMCNGRLWRGCLWWHLHDGI